MSTGVSKIAAERNHRVLLELVCKPGNEICADCKARAPRWASYNLGIFICVTCASIHRKIGTHITKVKSITLDEWSKEQVEVMKEKGNIKSNALHNPNEARHPPPTNMTDSERDSELEKFIRSKYEFKRFMDRKSSFASQHLSTEPRGAFTRSRSTPLSDAAKIERKTSPGPPLPPKTPENLPLRYSATIPSLSKNALPPVRSVSQPLPPLTNPDTHTAAPPLRQPAGRVWEDLISLQEPSESSSLPLQYNPAGPTTPFSSQPQFPAQPLPATPGTAPNPFMNLSLGHPHATTPLVPSPVSISPQFPFVPAAPLSSPAPHLGATNPFNQAFASAAGTPFSTGSNPFSSSMGMAAASTPTTPSVQPVVAPPLGYFSPQRSTSTSTPTLQASFPSTSFASAPATASVGSMVQHPFAPPMGVPGQVPLLAGVPTNPFSAMQMGQAGFSGSTGPHAAAVPGQQHHPLGPTHAYAYGGWVVGQGVQGTF